MSIIKTILTVVALGLLTIFMVPACVLSLGSLESETQARQQTLSKEELRQRAIQRDFIGGAHLDLVVYLKKYLKDPSSLQVIETRHQDGGEYYIVAMSYRAKNSFNGYAIGFAAAKVDIQSKRMTILKMDDEGVSDRELGEMVETAKTDLIEYYKKEEMEQQAQSAENG